MDDSFHHLETALEHHRGSSPSLWSRCRQTRDGVRVQAGGIARTDDRATPVIIHTN